MEKTLEIKVVPKAKKQKIVEENGKLKVYLKSPPEDGKANKELIEVLSKYLKVKKNKIEIIKGQFSRNKVVKIKA